MGRVVPQYGVWVAEVMEGFGYKAKETLKKPVFRETAALYPAWLLGCIFRERTFSDHP